MPEPTATDSTEAASVDPQTLSDMTWEERAADADQRLRAFDFSDAKVVPDTEVEGATFTRLAEASERFIALAEQAKGPRSNLDILTGTTSGLGDKSLRADTGSAAATSSSGAESYELGRVGDEVVDASLAAREAEMREAASFIGLDGAKLKEAAAETFNMSGTAEAIDAAAAAVSALANQAHSVYVSGEQQWFVDLIGERTRTLDLLGELSSASELGAIKSGANLASESVNQVVQALNVSAQSYNEQFVRAVEDKASRESLWESFKRVVAGNFGVANPLDMGPQAQPIVPNYGYIPALDTAATQAEAVSTTLSSVATNELVGQMRDLAGPLASQTDGAGKGSVTGKEGPMPGGSSPSGNTGMRQGGSSPTRRGSSSSQTKSSSSKKGASDEKVREVADKLASLFEGAGGGQAGAAAVADAASAQGVTAAQLAAAGMSPEMLAAMNHLQQGGTFPTALDQQLAGLGGTHLSNAGDLAGVRGALGAPGALGTDLAGGAAGVRPFSPEARAMDSMLPPTPAPSIGDPVRRTALGADMRPLDPGGTGRVSPDSVPATRQNTTDANGNPRPVETTIMVAGEEHEITIDDPRLMEMMNIVSAEGTPTAPVEILEAAKRAGMDLSSYGDYIANPMEAKPGDVVISGKGSGFYMGEGRVLMESGEIRQISEILELRPPESGIFRLALPEIAEGGDGHQDWDEQGKEKTPASPGGTAPTPPPAGESAFDPFAKTEAAAPSQDAPMDSPVVPDTTAPSGTAVPPGSGSLGSTWTPSSAAEPPRVAGDLPVSDAPASWGSSAGSSVSVDEFVPVPEPVSPAPGEKSAETGSVPAEALGMVEVEYEGRPLGEEPVRY